MIQLNKIKEDQTTSENNEIFLHRVGESFDKINYNAIYCEFYGAYGIIDGMIKKEPCSIHLLKYNENKKYFDVEVTFKIHDSHISPIICFNYLNEENEEMIMKMFLRVLDEMTENRDAEIPRINMIVGFIDKDFLPKFKKRYIKYFNIYFYDIISITSLPKKDSTFVPNIFKEYL